MYFLMMKAKFSPSVSFFPAEQFAGFNPSRFGLGGPQPQTLFPEEGQGPEEQQAFMAPQKEMASFYQVPGGGGMIESPRVNEFYLY